MVVDHDAAVGSLDLYHAEDCWVSISRGTFNIDLAWPLSVSGVRRKMASVLPVQIYRQPSVPLSEAGYEGDPFLLNGRIEWESGPGGEAVLVFGRSVRRDFLDLRIQIERNNCITKPGKR